MLTIYLIAQFILALAAIVVSTMLTVYVLLGILLLIHWIATTLVKLIKGGK
jgi:hypothetical protein